MKLKEFQDSLDEEEPDSSSGRTTPSTKHIEVILDIVKNINQSLILKDVLELVLSNAIKITNSERGFIVLKTKDDELEFNLGLDSRGKKLPESDFVVSMTVVKDVFEMGESIFMEGAKSDTDRDPSKSILNLELETILCSPLITEHKKIGVIYVDSRSIQEINKKELTNTFEILAGQAATAIRNAKLYYGQQESNTALQKANKEILEAKEKAEKSERLKSEFLALMSHEIRTPLNAIMNSSSVIMEDFVENIDENVKTFFDIIDSASHRLIRTVDLILNVSELQTGTFEVINKDINMYDDVLEKLYAQFKPDADSKNLELILNKNTKETIIKADEYSVFQIFTNLIDNAIKYTKEGKVIIDIMRDNNNKLNVIVSDTGIGISEEFMPDLFDSFSQEDKGYTRKFEGSGLGLALVKKYCDVNNAEIKVVSKKDKGTTFTVIFNA